MRHLSYFWAAGALCRLFTLQCPWFPAPVGIIMTATGTVTPTFYMRPEMRVCPTNVSGDLDVYTLPPASTRPTKSTQRRTFTCERLMPPFGPCECTAARPIELRDAEGVEFRWIEVEE